jgi:hypothetical protein
MHPEFALISIYFKILEMIPEDWSVEMLQEFLIRSLRRSLDDYNESQIVLGLGRGENLMVNAKYTYMYICTQTDIFLKHIALNVSF